MSAPWLSDLPKPPDDGAPVATILVFVLMAVLFSGFGYWAYDSEIDIVSVAAGEVKPSSRVQNVQHLEGGIVDELLVREGDFVSAGDPLVSLSAIRSEADLDELRVRLAGLRIDRIRLTALAEERDTVEFPDDLKAEMPGLVNKATALFDAATRQTRARTDRLEKTAQQRQQEIREIETRMKNTRNNMALLEEQLKISEELLKKGITNRYNHIDLEREFLEMKGSVEEDKAALGAARAALDVAESMIREARFDLVEKARQELAGVDAEFDGLSTRVSKYRDSLARTTLRAPVDGVVKELMVSSIGEVVKPGDTIVALVPGDDRLIVEAQLPPQEIGYVKVGQRALIKLNSADLTRFGNINGTVAQVSPDRLVLPDGTPYFRVRIDADRSYFEHYETRYDLYPGTQVVASIQTGKRTILDYLVSPLLGGAGEAFRER
ncbi:MAG: HlyD family type I secretion periplasmic adaptor subunit [Alphaproteobacteria bacterium]